jgi:hypothetical protein
VIVLFPLSTIEATDNNVSGADLTMLASMLPILAVLFDDDVLPLKAIIVFGCLLFTILKLSSFAT